MEHILDIEFDVEGHRLLFGENVGLKGGGEVER
jgi:hypothetical protein